MDNAGSSQQPLCFDVMAQLANIPTRITLYELFRLCAYTRKALREDLGNAEFFVVHVEATQMQEKSEPTNLQYRLLLVLQKISRSRAIMTELSTLLDNWVHENQ